MSSSSSSSSSPPTHKHIIDIISSRIIPPLSSKLHKGQHGRIGILGGSGDYTGAPFFSAIGSLKFGADLAHVICEPGAAQVIKTYSPDLIVHGILDEKKSRQEIKDELKGLMERLHVLIIGPGLGRTEHTQTCARIAFELAKDAEDVGLVVDADGLWTVAQDPSVILGWQGRKRVILTPNIMEFKRLCEKMRIDPKAAPDTLCPQLARALENTTILQKGAVDIISNGLAIPKSLLPSSSSKDDVEILKNETPGGLKRCGGQGDILSGSTGVLLAWGTEWLKGTYERAGRPPPEDSEDLAPHIPLLAAYGASTFNRTCSRRTFEAKGRSMVTEDMIERVGGVFEEVFNEDSRSEDEQKSAL